MNEYVPDTWSVFKITNEGETFYKILGGWYGGYINGDSWRVNSGIERVELLDGQYHFHGFSGSVYKCSPDSYGMRRPTIDIWSTMKDRFPDQVELLEDCDWSQFNFGVK